MQTFYQSSKIVPFRYEHCESDLFLCCKIQNVV